MDVGIVVVIGLLVLVAIGAVVAVVRRERRDRALASRLDAADPGAGLRARAGAERQHEGPRGEAGGMSRSAGGHDAP